MNSSETKNTKEGEVSSSNLISGETILLFLSTVVFLSTALLKPELYTPTLNLFLFSTKFIGFHIIQFCQTHAELLVGGLATGVGTYALHKLLNRLRSKDE
jgi:hypothetical protein